MKNKLKLIFGLLCFTQIAFAQWEKISDTTVKDRIFAMHTTSDSIYLAGDRGVFSSHDGITWKFIGGGNFNGYYFTSDVTSNDTALFTSSSYGVFYSKFDGEWNKVGNGVGLPAEKYLEVITNRERVLVRNSNYEVYAFDLTTGAWVKQNFARVCNTISTNGTDFLAGSPDYLGAYRYNIKNATWTEIPYFYDDVVNEFFQKGDTILAVFKKAGDSLAISVDNGQSWESKLMPISSYYYSAFQKSDNVLFLSIYDYQSARFYISLDNGSNWTSALSGFADPGIRDIQIFKGYIYASTPDNSGLYRRQLSHLSGIIYNGQGKLEAINVRNATYQWFLNGVSIPSANLRTLQAYTNGKYKVEITVQDNLARVEGSQVISYEFVVTDLLTTGFNNPTEGYQLSFVSYDPNRQSISVHTTESFNFAQIEVFNVLGQRLFQRRFEEENSTFQLSLLPLGPCVVMLNLDGRMQAYRVYIY